MSEKIDPFGKYNRKNSNPKYKNKKKNFKNNNEMKHIYNGKVELNENKYYEGENRVQMERGYSRDITPSQDSFNRNVTDRVFTQKNQRSNDEILNSTIQHNIGLSINKTNVENRDIKETLNTIKTKIVSKINVNDIENKTQNRFVAKSNSFRNTSMPIVTAISSSVEDNLKTESAIIFLDSNLNTCDEQNTITEIESIRHPLCCSWQFWHTMTGNAFKDSLLLVKEFDTVEDFWCLVNNMKPPINLNVGSDFSLFKSGIKPMWEDKMNENGGAIVATLKNEYDSEATNILWLDTLLSMIDGQTYGPYFNQICGAVVSIRPKLQRISLWISSRNDKIIEEIQKKFITYLREGGFFSKRNTVNFKPHETK